MSDDVGNKLKLNSMSIRTIDNGYVVEVFFIAEDTADSYSEEKREIYCKNASQLKRVIAQVA